MGRFRPNPHIHRFYPVSACRYSGRLKSAAGADFQDAGIRFNPIKKEAQFLFPDDFGQLVVGAFHAHSLLDAYWTCTFQVRPLNALVRR
jgi:hypothetical protein